MIPLKRAQYRNLQPRSCSGQYLFSVIPSIAGCPGLVPGWRAVYNYNTRLAPHSPPARPFSPQSRCTGTGARRDGQGGDRGIRCVARNAHHPGTRLRAWLNPAAVDTVLRRGKARPGQLQMALNTYPVRRNKNVRIFRKNLI